MKSTPAIQTTVIGLTVLGVANLTLAAVLFIPQRAELAIAREVSLRGIEVEALIRSVELDPDDPCDPTALATGCNVFDSYLALIDMEVNGRPTQASTLVTYDEFARHAAGEEVRLTLMVSPNNPTVIERQRGDRVLNANSNLLAPIVAAISGVLFILIGGIVALIQRKRPRT